ncbi:hypothetical protein H1R17_07335 [Flavobacterium sp. xlx-214]|uniref:hypothetical protein n=1 Tax=unclassified Flavobacterium TaxID=196869 RepID=UPI0013D441B6|nr:MULTISPECIES: hypothetical protein [unclassified Flavobacterium]MBA5792528.1 hypothetical protein [Flavobacterium sp. xlx-221]QMI82320.1 hypothetical protein H1R17_07335 [Flavobacterium sp. xlx-214]
MLFLILSCGKTKKSEVTEINSSNNISNLTKASADEKKIIQFTKFKPDSSFLKINRFSSNTAFQINDNYILTGYYESIDGKISYPDKENDHGHRLLFVNSKKEIKYKSFGVCDVYLYQPNFYKNGFDDRIIIVCQLAYEYFFGGEAFLIEKNKIKYLGNIDIESNDMETNLVEILKIRNENDKLIFSFDSDSLLLKPGSDDIIVKNNNIRYEYDGKSFRLIK